MSIAFLWILVQQYQLSWVSPVSERTAGGWHFILLTEIFNYLSLKASHSLLHGKSIKYKISKFQLWIGWRNFSVFMYFWREVTWWTMCCITTRNFSYPTSLFNLLFLSSLSPYLTLSLLQFQYLERKLSVISVLSLLLSSLFNLDFSSGLSLLRSKSWRWKGGTQPGKPTRSIRLTIILCRQTLCGQFSQGQRFYFLNFFPKGNFFLRQTTTIKSYAKIMTNWRNFLLLLL